MIHVFIDTSVFLNFYEFTKEDLDSLHAVFATHEFGSATVHLTQQVRNEFSRRREATIKAALKQFSNANPLSQLPAFMKPYSEYEDIRRLTDELKATRSSLEKEVLGAIASKDLLADRLITEIFDNSLAIDTTPELYSAARMRFDLGNPPGKNKSIGDAVNWLALLNQVPQNEALHLISVDGDFFSMFSREVPNPFLADEWTERKNAKLFVYDSLSRFLQQHFDGVAFSYDVQKEASISALAESPSFAATHLIVTDLASHRYYSVSELERILDATISNDQVGPIVEDMDISDFLTRVAVPRQAEFQSEAHRRILERVIAAQSKRESTDQSNA